MVDRITLFQSLCNGEDAEVGRISKGVLQIVELRMVVTHEAVHALSNHTQAFLNHLLERTSDRHDLTNRLHAGANLTAHTYELRQVPTRNLTNHIVEARSHICGRCRTHLTNLVKGVAEGNLRCHEGEGITCCLGGEGRRTTQTCIDFNDTIVVGIGIESKLDVTLSDDA